MSLRGRSTTIAKLGGKDQRNWALLTLVGIRRVKTPLGAWVGSEQGKDHWFEETPINHKKEELLQ